MNRRLLIADLQQKVTLIEDERDLNFWAEVLQTLYLLPIDRFPDESAPLFLSEKPDGQSWLEKYRRIFSTMIELFDQRIATQTL